MIRHIRLFVIVSWCMIAPARASAAAPPPPEIFSIDPDYGPAGTPLSIKGRNFEGVRGVLFATSTLVRRATFKIVSSSELKVKAPDFLQPGVVATIVVVSPHGATIAVPPSVLEIDNSIARKTENSTFTHVHTNATLNRATGMTLIERGGLVADGGTAPLHFVKRGGVLQQYNHSKGLIIEEPGSGFGPKFTMANSVEGRIPHIFVREITMSKGIPPYLYESPTQPDAEAKRVPWIESINPPLAISGEVITVYGSGFSGTTNVLFLSSANDAVEKAGFQVVSDSRIRVEVPTKSGAHRGQNLIVVINRKGAVLTVPPFGPMPIPKGVTPIKIQVVAAGQVLSKSPASIVLIENGGAVTRAGSVLFVKNGGRVATPNARSVFCEDKVQIPDTLERSTAGNLFVVHRLTFCTISPLLMTYVE